MARSEPDFAICLIQGANHLSNLRWRPDPPRLWTVPGITVQVTGPLKKNGADFFLEVQEFEVNPA
jgi:hypothetical protein